MSGINLEINKKKSFAIPLAVTQIIENRSLASTRQ